VSTSTSLLIAASVAIAALGAPLALKLVPPNRLYGFRTSQALVNRELWFRVNRVAGWSMIAAGGMSAVIYLQFGDGVLGPAYEIGVFVLPLVVALAVTGSYVKSISARGNDG
jgi:uncharacterized membrane protein